ncbi:MAG: glycosyltransferase family 4 protein [Myxococcota bacterium]|nr:glycosyltransferase family 4 protein [Myxococcota bacterium]
MTGPPRTTGAQPASRVAIVTTSWPRYDDDAAGHFVRTEALQLERAGHELVVLAAPSGGCGDAFGWPGVATRLRERPTRAIGAAYWVMSTRTRLARLEVARVVAHWAVPSAWPIGVVTRGSIEVVSHGGDVRLLAASPRALRRHVVLAIASRADRWRFVSQPLLLDLLRTLDRDVCSRVEQIATVQPAAIEMPDVSNAISQRRRSFGGARVAVSVARLIKSKRVDRAIDHLAESGEFDVLVIVGDGPERSRLERLAHSRRVDARFIGMVSRRDSLAWIGAADALLHASSAEGSSTVLREAEALGTAIRRLDCR